MYKNTVVPGVEYLDVTVPTFAQFELTPGCPYRCRMCYNVWKGTIKNGPILTKEQQFEVIDKLDRVFSIIFSGGEPTTIAWLPELVAYAKSKSIQTSLITIADGLTLEKAKALCDAGLQHIQVSLHHYDNKISDEITGRSNSRNRTLQGALNLLEVFGSDRISVNMVANSHTANDVYKMGEFLRSKGFSSMSVGVLSQSGAATANGLTISADDLRVVCEQLDRLSSDFAMYVGLTGGVPFCALKGISDNVQVNNICDAAINQVVVGPDGNCRPCVEWPFSGGNILTSALDEIWQSNVFQVPRQFKDVPKTCYSCVYVSRCRGGCRASAYNSTTQIDSYDPLMACGGSFITPDMIEEANPHLLDMNYEVSPFEWQPGTYSRVSEDYKVQNESWGGLIQIEADGWATVVEGREVMDAFLAFSEKTFVSEDAIPDAIRQLIALGLVVKVD